MPQNRSGESSTVANQCIAIARTAPPALRQQRIDELRMRLVAINMSASGTATQAAVAVEANPGTVRVENHSENEL